MVKYSDSGVNIDLEETIVSNIASKLKDTLKWREVITESGHFAALIRFGDKGIAMSTDGVGSKILVANLMDKYDTIGIDCIAMIVNDILCVGAEPLALVDYLSIEDPNPSVCDEIVEGLVTGANISKIAIIGGETASLPDIVNDFDLAGTGIGLVDIDNIITGENINSGDIVIGIESSGIHSNGLSLARKILLEDNNLNVKDSLPGFPDLVVGEELLKPTMIYVDPIMDLLKSNINVLGMAHITGGGFTNLKRLNNKVGFDINCLPDPHPIFKSIYSLDVPIDEMYRVFNMGIGFIVIVNSKDSDKTLDILNKDINAYVIGNVTKNADKIAIKTFINEEIKL